MDDYSDLVMASLALLCAGIMLVAGQLTIEHSATNAPMHGDKMPPGSGASQAMVSRAPSLEEKASEPRREPEKKRDG
jgi:hypothetical protein